MMEMIVIVLMLFLMLKITGFLFKIAGHVIGFVFGIIGSVFIGVLSVAAFGLALVFLPVIAVLGIVGIMALAARIA